MKKVINSNEVGINAFISLKQQSLTDEEIKEFITLTREKTKDNKEYYISDFSLENFKHFYNYLFDEHDKKNITISTIYYNKHLLNHFFREKTPIDILLAYDEVASEIKKSKEETKEEVKTKVKVKSKKKVQ